MNQQAAPNCPNDILDILPGYVQGEVSPEQRDRVETHAATCGDCRTEIEMLSGRAIPPAAPVPNRDEIYSRSLGLIEAYELAKPRNLETATQTSSTTPPTWRSQQSFALAASLLVALGIGALAGFWGASLREPSAAVYRTATDPAAPTGATAADAIHIDVMFRGEATADRIRSALRAIGGTVVSGPSRLGVYRIRLGESGDASAAAAMLLGEGSGVATFAEPVQR